MEKNIKILYSFLILCEYHWDFLLCFLDVLSISFENHDHWCSIPTTQSCDLAHGSRAKSRFNWAQNTRVVQKSVQRTNKKITHFANWNSCWACLVGFTWAITIGQKRKREKKKGKEGESYMAVSQSGFGVKRSVRDDLSVGGSNKKNIWH